MPPVLAWVGLSPLLTRGPFLLRIGNRQAGLEPQGGYRDAHRAKKRRYCISSLLRATMAPRKDEGTSYCVARGDYACSRLRICNMGKHLGLATSARCLTSVFESRIRKPRVWPSVLPPSRLPIRGLRNRSANSCHIMGRLRANWIIRFGIPGIQYCS